MPWLLVGEGWRIAMWEGAAESKSLFCVRIMVLSDGIEFDNSAVCFRPCNAVIVLLDGCEGLG